MEAFERTLGQEELGGFYLHRLARSIECAAAAEAIKQPQWLRLSRISLVTAYRDCCALGLQREAGAIVDRAALALRRSGAPPRAALP